MKYLTWVGFLGDRKGGPPKKIGFSISIVTDIKPDTQVSGSFTAEFQKDVFTNDESGEFDRGANIGVGYDDIFANLSDAERDVIKKVFKI
jgi:hypothetical protein